MVEVPTGILPRWMCMSVPHTPLAMSLSLAMPFGGGTSSYSRSSKGSFTPVITAAFAVLNFDTSFRFPSLFILTVLGALENILLNAPVERDIKSAEARNSDYEIFIFFGMFHRVD